MNYCRISYELIKFFDIDIADIIFNYAYFKSNFTIKLIDTGIFRHFIGNNYKYYRINLIIDKLEVIICMIDINNKFFITLDGLNIEDIQYPYHIILNIT